MITVKNFLRRSKISLLSTFHQQPLTKPQNSNPAWATQPTRHSRPVAKSLVPVIPSSPGGVFCFPPARPTVRRVRVRPFVILGALPPPSGSVASCVFSMFVWCGLNFNPNLAVTLHAEKPATVIGLFGWDTECRNGAWLWFHASEHFLGNIRFSPARVWKWLISSILLPSRMRLMYTYNHIPWKFPQGRNLLNALHVSFFFNFYFWTRSWFQRAAKNATLGPFSKVLSSQYVYKQHQPYFKRNIVNCD